MKGIAASGNDHLHIWEEVVVHATTTALLGLFVAFARLRLPRSMPCAKIQTESRFNCRRVVVHVVGSIHCWHEKPLTKVKFLL